jgi:hypothetical protein
VRDRWKSSQNGRPENANERREDFVRRRNCGRLGRIVADGYFDNSNDYYYLKLVLVMMLILIVVMMLHIMLTLVLDI